MKRKPKLKIKVKKSVLVIITLLIIVFIGIVSARLIIKRNEMIEHDPRFQTENYYETSKKMTEMQRTNQSYKLNFKN